MGESLYKRRVADKKCGMCGTDNPDGPLCPGCKETCKQRAAEKRARNREKGCIGCGKPVESGSRCETCKAAAKVSRQKSTEKKKAAGICQATGCKNEVKPGTTLCQACIDYRSEVSSEHYRRRKDAGTCVYCNSPPVDDLVVCERHREMYTEYRRQTKLDAVNAYGGPVCVGCDSEEVAVLEIDHIDGGGCAHRREIEVSGGYQFYLWLKQQGYPAGYRVLCPTCNKKAHRGLLDPK